MENTPHAAGRYRESCQRAFWQKIFQIELEYLTRHLKGCRDVLSVGCGPAIIEGGLAERGFSVTGLDISGEALRGAPPKVRVVVALAEDIPLPDNSFDAVIYVASLQFVDDYRRAVEDSTRVLRPGGRIIIMLLNPESDFITRKRRDPDSYVSKIKHTDIREIEAAVAENYSIQGEFFLGVKGNTVCVTQDAAIAVLYVIRGARRQKGKRQDG